MYHCNTEADPKCQWNLSRSNDSNVNDIVMEFDIITMTCTVNYSGYWDPSMIWQQESGSVITTVIVDKIDKSKSLTSSLTMVVSRNINGQKYSCTTYFNHVNKPITPTVENQPGYQFKWTTFGIIIECMSSWYSWYEFTVIEVNNIYKYGSGYSYMPLLMSRLILA